MNTKHDNALAARPALNELLAALGFEAMAQAVMMEDELSRIIKYVRVVINKSRPEYQLELVRHFRSLNLY